MDKQILLKLYSQMLRIRLIEEKIAEIYPQQEIRCPVHLCIGQEAIPVGVCAQLTSEDYIMSNHRSHGHYLAKGGDLKSMMAELFGKRSGCCSGKGGSMHLVDISAGFLGSMPIVGSSIPIAVGAALGSVMQGRSRITVVFFGEGATEEGVFQESINFAVLKNLPIVFVCENNLYSVYSPLSVRQPAGREVFRVAESLGIESYQGDGNDIFEVYRFAEQAVHKARENRGPTFLEFKTYRWLEHCGPNYDNDLGYRTNHEFNDWKKRCPLAQMREYLLQEQLFSGVEEDGIVNEINREIDGAICYAKESPFPGKQFLLEHIYAS